MRLARPRPHPDPLPALPGHPQLRPRPGAGVPDQPVHREGVEKLVAEDDAVYRAGRQRLQVRHPPHAVALPGQPGRLPGAAGGGGFDQEVLDPRGQVRRKAVPRFKEVGRQAAIVGAQFHHLQARGRQFPQPARQPHGQQGTKDRADADAGEKVPATAEALRALLVVPQLRRVQCRGHEGGKRHRAVRLQKHVQPGLEGGHGETGPPPARVQM